MTSDEPKLTCVTGASGYIGAHVVQRLLDRGHRVRAAVRDPNKARSVDPLKALPGAEERLELVRGNLNEPGSYDEACAGCEVVFHLASPYALTVDDPQRDLVDPAVQGTTSVLQSCVKAGTVQRVVLTSSMAAITDEPDGRILTEADWNTSSSLSRNPYYFSKAEAERAAWAFVERERRPFDLVVINPFLVIGPSLSPSLNTSPGVLRDLLSGGFPGIVDLVWGFVDVRDVAEAHVRAMEVAEAKGRYICAGQTVSMREVVELLRDRGHEGLPSMALDNAIGRAIVWCGSWFQPKGAGTYLRTHLGRVPRYDNRKIQDDLGISFRSAESSILDTIGDLRRWGHLPSET
ncbi:MAG: NAD-dependent epimerase/dehydratase family protein [Deltaproteobacteria bacterium]|nr:MAG: NAD-dependent epimerase/dehydratase family protein [Deltaproteobacteria bacterium]